MRITLSPPPGRLGTPVTYSGDERRMGHIIDVTMRCAVEAGIRVRMNLFADPIPHARLTAYTKFAVAMEKLDAKMIVGFDFRDYMISLPENGQ